MIKYNSLILNGESSAGFPFYVAVEEVPGLVRANKKDKLFKTDYASGAIKQSVEAYDTISLKFIFYLHDVNRNELRKFKKWLKDEGRLVRYDDPLIHYNYLSVEITSEVLDEVNGYQVTAEFECEPFEYEEEEEIDITNLQSITNRTNAPMYPKLTIVASSSSPMYLKIGPHKMNFKKGLNGTYEIECKHNYQNIKNIRTGKLENDLATGPFFEIPKDGSWPIEKSSGFQSIKMLTRWGWR
ncbi:hypothetical protein ACQV2T_06765 [Facklamia sp. P13069]|uniref:hypothetical protein n=1 Tax=Facklamia sp. P13069 TaxID=3421954 RepID=UPI003D168FE1